MKPRLKLWTAAKRAVATFRATLSGVRAYAMAQHNRLTANWSSFPIAANRELRLQLRPMRNRARNLAQNDDYIKRFLSLLENNVAGPKGFKFLVSLDPVGEAEPSQAQQKTDAAIVRQIERAFEEWSHPENASASGKLSFVDQQRLFIRTMARDGEVLIHRMVDANNPFRYTLKFIDVAWLDEFFNDTNTQTGNRIIMSVEVDENDRPAAYWLTMPPAEYLYGNKSPRAPYRQRVPAAQMIHAFLVDQDESQARGMTWLHTAGMTLKVLDEADFAELVNMHIASCNLPYLIPPKDAVEETLPDPPAGGEMALAPIPRPIEQDVQPGIQQILPPGYDVKTFMPSHPNPNHPLYAKSQLRRASAGLEVAYASLANDLEGANYSSLKAGRTEEQKTYRARQTMVAEKFNRIVGWEWLRMAVLAGRVTLSVADFQRVRLNWRGEGFASIEPLKEIQATILAINNFLDDPIADAAERGEDWMDIIERLKKVKVMVEAAGLTILPVESKPTVKKESDEEAAAGDGEDKPKDDGTERALPIFEHQLLPPALRALPGMSQPIVIVLNQASGGAYVPSPPSPANGDSRLLGD